MTVSVWCCWDTYCRKRRLSCWYRLITSPLFPFGIACSHLSQTELCCVFRLLCDATLTSLYEISPSFCLFIYSQFIALVVRGDKWWHAPFSCADKPHNPMVNAGAIVISSLIKVKFPEIPLIFINCRGFHFNTCPWNKLQNFLPLTRTNVGSVFQRRPY